MPINPVLDTPTAVTKDQVMFVAFADVPRGFMLTESIGPGLIEEFSSTEQIQAIKDLMRANGWDIAQLQQVDSSVNYNPPPDYQHMVRTSLSVPWIWSLSGQVTLPNGKVTVVSIQVGDFINRTRIQFKGINQPRDASGEPYFGDNIGVYFNGPLMPVVIWTQLSGAAAIVGQQQ